MSQADVIFCMIVIYGGIYFFGRWMDAIDRKRNSPAAIRERIVREMEADPERAKYARETREAIAAVRERIREREAAARDSAKMVDA